MLLMSVSLLMAIIRKNINNTVNNHCFLMRYNIILLLLLLYFFCSSYSGSYAMNQKFIITIPQGGRHVTVPTFYAKSNECSC